MSAPKSYGKIEFPFSLIDSDIRKILEEEGVRFKPQVSDSGLELDEPLYDLEVEVNEGIFSMQNSEARYGEYGDLETLLVEKGIPFERTSGMDWNQPPERRIFRPGQPNFDKNFPLDSDAYGEVVSVAKIRELLAQPEAADDIKKYLDELFPAYPPLADWVKEEEKS